MVESRRNEYIAFAPGAISNTLVQPKYPGPPLIFSPKSVKRIINLKTILRVGNDFKIGLQNRLAYLLKKLMPLR